MGITIAQIARTAHEVNRAYCEAIGDMSQPVWSEAPLWQMTSAIDGVLHVRENPEATPEDSHRNWLESKSHDGWVWGPKKDPELKQHPCIVPYRELPAAQQVKDHLFLILVKTLLQVMDAEKSLE